MSQIIPDVAELRESIYALIDAEREEQDAKWGQQDHTDPYWLGILMEEVGEIAKAVIERQPQDELDLEIIQTMAVCVSWLEAQERRPLVYPDTQGGAR